MPEIAFSRRAESDLMAIDDYTVSMWNVEQADRYLDQIDAALLRLAKNPKVGRLWSPARPGLRRMEHREHIIFYRETRDGIFVSRILHRGMLPQWQSFEDT